MKESDLSEFQIKEEGLELCIKRGFTPSIQQSGISTPAQFAPQTVTVPVSAPPAQQASAVDEKTHYIKSPMVGTFYKASSPDNPPLVRVGDKVDKTTTVCILEAMKVMNEIHAEVQGVVTEILVENGQTTEYGQPLFKIKLG